MGLVSEQQCLNGRLTVGWETIGQGENAIYRAKLFLDEEGARYEFIPKWDEVINRPDMREYVMLNNYNTNMTTINNSIDDLTNTKVNKNSGIAANLSITPSLGENDPKATLSYNNITQSLDFTFN